MTARGLTAFLLVAALAPSVALGRDPTPATNPLDSRRREAVANGLGFLSRVQNRDGSFGEKDGVVGVTSLCLLAFFAQGHQDGRGPYGDVLRRGVDYLLRLSLTEARRGMPEGYIWYDQDSDSRMHGHGYATQVLVLAYGCGKEEEERTRLLKKKIALAVSVIENSQSFTGGWYYEPNSSSGHEGSVTVTVVQALRLAADSGFLVKREVVDQGLKYLHRSQKDNGSFKYSLMQDRSSAALTAAAITAMHGFAEYYTEPVRRGMEFLRDEYAHPDEVEWTYYCHYYAAQAFWRAGGQDWREWERRVIPMLLEQQQTEGSLAGAWDDSRGGQMPRTYGPAFATAFTCLALSVQDGYLPLFQR